MHFDRLRRRALSALAAVAVAVVFAWPAAGTAEAQAERRVGLVVTTSINLSPGEADAISDRLARALRAELSVDVISGSETRRRLPLDGLPDDCVARAECRNELGERLDAPELLLLVIVKVGKRVQIDATWTNVASGRVTSRPAVAFELDGDGDGDGDSALRGAAPSLLPHLRSEPLEPVGSVVLVPAGEDAADAAGDPEGPASARSDRRGPDRPAAADTDATTGALAGPTADRAPRLGLPVWIAGGVSVVALGSAVGFSVSAAQQNSFLEDNCGTATGCTQGQIDALDRRALAADVFYGIAGAAAIGAVVLYVLKDDDEPRSSVSMGVGPGAVGLSIGGRF